MAVASSEAKNSSASERLTPTVKRFRKSVNNIVSAYLANAHQMQLAGTPPPDSFSWPVAPYDTKYIVSGSRKDEVDILRVDYADGTVIKIEVGSPTNYDTGVKFYTADIRHAELARRRGSDIDLSYGRHEPFAANYFEERLKAAFPGDQTFGTGGDKIPGIELETEKPLKWDGFRKGTKSKIDKLTKEIERIRGLGFLGKDGYRTEVDAMNGDFTVFDETGREIARGSDIGRTGSIQYVYTDYDQDGRTHQQVVKNVGERRRKFSTPPEERPEYTDPEYLDGKPVYQIPTRYINSFYDVEEIKREERVRRGNPWLVPL